MNWLLRIGIGLWLLITAVSLLLFAPIAALEIRDISLSNLLEQADPKACPGYGERDNDPILADCIHQAHQVWQRHMLSRIAVDRLMSDLQYFDLSFGLLAIWAVVKLVRRIRHTRAASRPPAVTAV